EQNRADFGFFQVQGDPEHAVRKFDHLVEHHVAQAFDACDAIAAFTDNADIALRCRCFESRNFRFNFFKNTAHGFGWLKFLLKSLQSVAESAVPDVAADAHPQPAE